MATRDGDDTRPCLHILPTVAEEPEEDEKDPNARPPNPQVIELLEGALEAAQEGRLLGLAIALDLSDGQMATAFYYDADGSFAGLYTATALLSERILHSSR